MVSESNVRIQYARLVRHHDASLLQMDPISMLDLSNTLRIWADMKQEVDTDLATRVPDLKLPVYQAEARHVRKLAKGNKYVYAPLCYGVGSPSTRVQGIVFVYGMLGMPNEEERKQSRDRERLSVKLEKISFTNWLNSDMCEMGNMGTVETKRMGISREMLIRRVANILGGSHPQSDEVFDKENRFDPCIKELHAIVVGTCPLTYYMLLEIAACIIDGLKTFYGEL